MKGIYLILVMLFLAAVPVKAQQHELGFFAGGSYYIGDINPYYHFAQTQPALGLLYRYNINYRWAIRLHGMYGSITGSDATIKYNESRNLSFKSPLMEIGTQVELTYYRFQIGSHKDYFTPYLFTGFSFFKFKPMAELNGEWYNLQALGTEGQGTTAYPDRKPYSLAGLSFPMGMGIKIGLGSSTVLGFEWGLRKTFTDYLDDVSTTYANPNVLASQNTSAAAYLGDPSENQTYEKTGFQRGDSNTNDWYSFAGMTLTFKIKDKSDHCPGVNKSRGNWLKKQWQKLKMEPSPSFL
ncbi:MAG: hypothetical protein C0592_05280 [Marinilabiliales bacterium]|mgnify:CR=1 FL=1|nr:MAG: hypothetical protein C0592_05280 [Marinilabiliales bacterium]